tara:strand:+ start:32476 stop:32697 length:222 start_codon:yes stop_codon:yes gene_type:complete
MKTDSNLKLSNQALGAIMMALQESLLNELDIVPILQGFELQNGNEGLTVMNPPSVRFSDDSAISNTDLKKMVK